MDNNELNTEQIILDAAEAEFLEKGYGNSKMMAIAKRANVSHSMLHYYFRSKENLFQTVFLKKAQVISSHFQDIFEQQLPFDKTIRLIAESQFDFVKQNPRLPHFILNEIISNESNRALLLDLLAPRLKDISERLSRMLTEEINKGAIRFITPYDLILNVVSMNVSTFVALPIVKSTLSLNDEYIQKMLKERCESNVQFILSGLRP